MTPVRAWLARIFGPTTTPCSPAKTGTSATRRSRPSRTRLEVESLEERNLLAGGTGLTGQYFADDHFGQLKVTRTDPTVNFVWGIEQSPVAGVPGTRYSVRWSGWVEPLYTQTYTFYTRSDDGVRLYVDGQKLIDDWTTHQAKELNATIRLVAGQRYRIQMDYFQATGSAQAQLLWSSSSQAKQIIPTGQLFTNSTPPPTDPAPVAKLSAGNVTAANGTTYDFKVTYTDNTGVDWTSLRTNNIRVTGPNGFSQLATLVSVDVKSNGTPRTATYRITPPGGKWDTADNGTYTVYLQASQVRDIKGNYAGPTSVGAFQVTVPSIDWFSTNLRDAGVRDLARSLASDKSLNRTEMLRIFRAVESNGVSSNELTDLRTLVSTTYVSMPEYVRDLSNKVVNGDPANARYQGRSLGNLYVGSSGTQLEPLLGKWFLGTDHPVAASNTHYAYAQGTLFGSGPTYTDVKQGEVADCYFLAGLGEIAFRSSTSIRNLFIDNGDNTFTIRFYRDGKPTYVTVDRYLPALSNNTYLYANYQASITNSANKLWVALAEKAYAQLAESGWSRPGNAVNSYNSLNLGWEGDVVKQVTGKSMQYQTIFYNSTTKSAIINAFNAGKMVGLDTKPTTASDIVPNHVYVMVGYNSSTNMVSLYNPWGKVQQLSWSQIGNNFEGWSQNIS